MIEAVIFDMDGVLIDSEPFWRQADIETYKTVGVHITEAMCLQTMGMSCTDAVTYWYNQFPWTGRSIVEVKDEIEARVVENVRMAGKPMAGVAHVLDYFESKKIPVALASSSAMHVIEAVLERLRIKHRLQVYHSAQFEPAGKPNPAVFLSTARMLHVDPAACLVFEDSINGIKAALAAGMKVVGVPEPHMRHDVRYSMAHQIIHSLAECNDDLIQKIENVAVNS